MTYNDQMLGIVEQYRAAGESWPASTRQIAAWGVERKILVPHPSSIVKRFADDIACAMREDYITDPQGRTVRAKHAARILKDGEQMTLWEDIRTAKPQHMQIAFQQRRQQIVGDCRQLKTDVDSFNETAKPIKPIQLVLDFTDDVAELEALFEAAD